MGDSARTGDAAIPTTVHRYVSTYCQHGQCKDQTCRLRCKICAAPCLCRCHYDGTGIAISPQ